MYFYFKYMRIIKIALISVLLLMFLQNVSANFVCGEVESNENYLPIWMNVIVYYESNPEEVTNCKINSEQKFCCDLWDIKSVSFAKDKKVFAEVFDLESGFVSNPVSLITTSEGFSVFPTLKIEKAIKISDFKKIIINEDSVFLNISLNERYNNLKYSVNSSEGFFERDLCSDCLKYEFYADVSRGKNEITLIAYNFDGEVEENFEVYSLDYLNLERKIDFGK